MRAHTLPAFLFLSTLLTAQTTARPATPEHLLPANTWLHLRLAGLGGGRTMLEQSGLYQLARRPETKDLTDRGMSEIEPKVQQALAHIRRVLEQRGVSADALRTLLKGPIAFGLGRMTVFQNGMMPSPLLVLDVAGREAEARTALAAVLKAVGSLTPAGHFTVDTTNHLGVEITRSGPESRDHCLAHAFVGGYLLVGFNEYYLKEAIAVSQGQGASLAQSASWRQHQGNLAGTPSMALELDLGFFLGWIERFLPYEATEIGKALGVEGLTGISLACSPAGRGDVTVLQIDIPGNESGLLKALTSRPLSFQAAAWLPADVGVFASVSLDGKALGAAAEQLLARIPAGCAQMVRKEFQREVVRGLNQELKAAGTSLAELLDCAATLGQELTVAATVPGKGDVIPEVMVFVQLSDAKAAEAKAIALLDRFAGEGAHKTLEFRNHTIHYVDVPGLGIKLTPSFAFVDQMLIASATTPALKKLLARGPKEQGSLAGDPRFAALVKETGRSNLFLDLRLPTAARYVHETWLPKVEGLLTSELGIDAAALPAPEVLEQLLEDLVCSVSVDRAGIKLSARSSFGLGSFLVGAMSGADWLLERCVKEKTY